jgi:hypothetical protein
MQRLQAQRVADAERIAQLEAAQRRGKRQAAPFSKDTKKADPKRPGRRPGEGKFSHRPAPPETQVHRTEEAPLTGCPHCHGAVADIRQQEHLQTDIPPVTPITIRFVTYSGWCDHCQQWVHSRHPEQVSTAIGAAGVSIGPHARSLAAELHHLFGVPYQKISRLFATAFGLSVTPSGLCQSNERLARVAEPVYREILRALRHCGSVHADETGWRISGLSTWLWTFTNSDLTIYTTGGRGHEVVVRILGKDFAGTLISDCFSAYDDRELSGWLKQKCFAHLLKNLSEIHQSKIGMAAKFSREVAQVLRDALALRTDKEILDPNIYTDRAAEIEAELDRLISPDRRLCDPDNLRMYNRLVKQRRHLFRFLYDAAVEPTNNRAERALRPAVIVRKTGGCNKTDSGARTHTTLSSILVTASQQGHNPLTYLAALLVRSPKLPSLAQPA